jgi:hypothetical protein
MINVQECKNILIKLFCKNNERYFHCRTVCIVNNDWLFDCAKYFDPALVLKCKQIECFEHILSGKDVIINLPVGYGILGVLKVAAMFLSHDTAIVTWF